MIATTETPSETAPPPAPPTHATRILLWLGAFSLIAAAVVSLRPPLGTALFGPPGYPWALASILLVTICAAALAGVRWRNFASRPERWAIPMAAAIGIAVLASPFADRAAFPALVLLLLPASIVVLAAWIEAGQNRAARCLHVFRATAAMAIGLSIWGLFSWAVVDFGMEAGGADHIGEITGLAIPYPSLFSLENPHPFGHKNFVAGFALLVLPILVVLVCLDKSRVRLLWLGGVPIVLFYLASAESRAGWLAFAAGAAFYIALRVWRARGIRLGWWAAPILLVVLTIPFLASPRLRESVQRAGQEETLAAVDPYRWDVFQTGLAVGNSRPLAGVGPGVLPLVSPEHSVSAQYPVVYQVHSTPIQLYAETGLLGILGGLVLAWGLVWAWWRNREKRPPLEGHLMDAAAIALIGYSAFALTDYQLDVPTIILAAAVPAGALLGMGGGSRGPGFRKTWVAIGAATAALLLPLFWFNGNGALARQHLHTAIAYLNSGDIEAFASAAERAHARAPTDPLYLNQLANVWLTEWLRTAEPAERGHLAEKARLVLERSIEIAPAQDSVHFNRGVLLRFQDKPEEALSAFQKALEYNPRKRFAWFLSGRTLLELDQDERAAEAFARELLTNPSSLFLPLWQEPEIQPHIEARNRHFERLADAANSTPAQRYLFYWATGNPRPFEGNPDKQRDGFRVLLTALEGDPQSAAELAPFTPEAFLVRAWLESDEAERWLRAGFLKATNAAFSHSNLQLIGDRLREGETFAAAFRTLVEEPGLPMTAKQGRPRASGLFERNFYGAPLFDFHVYHEPIVLLLF